MQYEPVIGLEVHAQLKTRTKIFCGCSTQFGSAPNANTCPVCAGMPGVLPVLNMQAVSFAIMASLATNCTINPESRFDRKNYFYPDLPKGYQISQYAAPLAEHGFLEIEVKGQAKRTIGITRIHMEEDAGKLIHDPARAQSRVDLNRTGIPLIEIVSEPDIRSAQEAGAYLRKLHAVLKYINVCDGNMEQGSFRCDANISLRPFGKKEFGTRTELKNLNSFKHVEKALGYETDRQTRILNEGSAVVQETRLWDPDKNRTHPMRGKEDAHDYRYFPDPDLVPLIVNDDWITNAAARLPELPDEKKQRFISDFGLDDDAAAVLTSSVDLANFFEITATPLENKKQTANFIMTTLLGMLNAKGFDIADSPVSAKDVSNLLALIEQGKINASAAKTICEEMMLCQKDPEVIVKEKDLEQISDRHQLESIVEQILTDSPDEIAAYKNGDTRLLRFFMGQIMKHTRGKADPEIVTRLLETRLSTWSKL